MSRKDNLSKVVQKGNADLHTSSFSSLSVFPSLAAQQKDSGDVLKIQFFQPHPRKSNLEHLLALALLPVYNHLPIEVNPDITGSSLELD